MTETKNQWLVSGHGILESYGSLRALCEGQKTVLGSGPTVIAENGVAVTIELWPHFDQDTTWTQGRFFGGNGEIQWRSYGSLVRVLALVDAKDETQAAIVTGRLQDQGLTVAAQQLAVTTVRLALQTNDDEFPAVTVYQYGSDQEPALFIRYGETLSAMV